MKRRDTLRDLRVVSFESRHAETMADLIRRAGGTPVAAPSMREVPLDDNPAALRFGEELLRGEIDVAVFLTGIGVRTLASVLEHHHPPERLAEALSRATVVARGPKAISALGSIGVKTTIRVPEPNTWRDLIRALDEKTSIENRTVALQEYGVSNRDLIRGLEARGAKVRRVPVYRWELPEDTGPLRKAARAITRGEIDVALFTNANQIRNLAQVAEQDKLLPRLRTAMKKRVLVASVGPVCSEALLSAGLPVDLEPSRPRMGHLVRETAEQAHALLKKKRSGRAAGAAGRAVKVGATGRRRKPVSPKPLSAKATARLEKSPFMLACRKKPAPHTPIWIMRQAGRYMREYREIRAKAGFLDLCKKPDLATEVTVMAAERLGVDAAIIFSDILLPLEPMGAGLEYAKGEGPVLHHPVRTGAAVDDLHDFDVAAELGFVYEAVRMVRSALPADLPLIGFAGAPFTLASYICEGGAAKNYEHTKTLMYRDSGAWHALLERFVRVITEHLNRQIDAGAQALQLFDSWVGCLGPDDYREYVLPHTQKLMAGIKKGVPVIHFGTGTAALLEMMREAGGDVIGLDWRVDLAEAWARIGHDVGVQGNLDPMVLFADKAEIRKRTKQILKAAAGRPGHIFNLGHGILPQTPVDHALALVEAVHEFSEKR